MSQFWPGRISKSRFTRIEKEKIPTVVVLAGGLGMRLRSAYAAGPKSMAPVGGRPFLDYLLRWLQSQGVSNVILCVGYKRRQIQKYVGKGRKWGLQVKYSVEKKLLGTGGAVKNAERLIPDKRLLVINGDTFLDLNLQEMIKFHRSREALATIATVRVADQQRYGSLNMDRAKRITAFLEKREIHEIDKLKEATRPVNAGIYVFEKRLLGEIRPGKATSLEKEIFPYLIAGKKLYCFTTNAYFIDIGIPNDFRRAQDEFPERFGIDAHC